MYTFRFEKHDSKTKLDIYFVLDKHNYPIAKVWNEWDAKKITDSLNANVQ